MTVTISGDSGIQNPPGTAAAPSVGTAQTGIFFPSSSTMAFSTNGAQAMLINASGNVGIATNNPLVALDMAQRPDAISLPRGLTSSRPVIAVAGMMRFNTSTAAYEGHDGTGWNTISTAAYSLLSISTTGYLLQDQVKSGDSNTTLDVLNNPYISGWFSAPMSLSIDSLGNLVANY